MKNFKLFVSHDNEDNLHITLEAGEADPSEIEQILNAIDTTFYPQEGSIVGTLSEQKGGQLPVVMHDSGSMEKPDKEYNVPAQAAPFQEKMYTLSFASHLPHTRAHIFNESFDENASVKFSLCGAVNSTSLRGGFVSARGPKLPTIVSDSFSASEIRKMNNFEGRTICERCRVALKRMEYQRAYT